MPVKRGEAEDLAATFKANLRQLRRAVRSPSYRALQRQADLTGLRLAHSTIGDLLNGPGIPRWETVEAFVSSCERWAKVQRLSLPRDTFDQKRWYADHDRMRSSVIGGGEHGGPKLSPPLIQPKELPADTGYFTGRRSELAQLLAACRDAADGKRIAGGVVVIIAVNGMAGVGKTALAIHAAHRLVDHFPDGCLFLDLHGHTPLIDPMESGAALERLLRALGVSGKQIPHQRDAKAALYRSRVANMRMLIVLDNAYSAEQVRPLLPAASRCLVLITSRQRLTALDEALPLILDALPMVDGLAMFADIAGADHVASNADAVERVVELCGRLPLAIRIAASRLRARPMWTITYLADQLTNQRGSLAELDDGERSVAAAFAVSYHNLTNGQRRMFRALGLHPGIEAGCYAAAALTRATLARASQLCEALVDANLLTQSVPGRYRFHDLVRAYATEIATIEDSEQERHAAITALFDHYLSMAALTMDALHPAEADCRPPVRSANSPAPAVADPDVARAWLNTELPNLVNVCAYSAAHGWFSHATRLAAILFRYLDFGSHFTEATAIYTYACRAARDSGDRNGEAHALTSLGGVYWQQGQYQCAADTVARALTIFGEIGDRSGEGRALTNLGIICWRQGHYELASEYDHRALTLYREITDPRGEARALGNVALVNWRQGRYQQAIEYNHRALTLYRQTNDPRGEARALGNLGNIYWRQGYHEQAADHHNRALRLYQQICDRAGEADAVTNLGLVFHSHGCHQRAADNHHRALALYQETGDGDGQARTHNGLGEQLQTTGQPDQARIHYDQALAITLDTGDRYEQARAHNGLGHTHHTTGNHDQARHHWQQAHAIYTELDVPDADNVPIS